MLWLQACAIFLISLRSGAPDRMHAVPIDRDAVRRLSTAEQDAICREAVRLGLLSPDDVARLGLTT